MVGASNAHNLVATNVTGLMQRFVSNSPQARGSTIPMRRSCVSQTGRKTRSTMPPS
jgi:hypothetical protein